MASTVIQILLLSVVSFLLLSLIKFGVSKYKITLNSYVYLAIGIIFTLIPMATNAAPGSILYLGATSLGLAFLLAFFEFKGWRKQQKVEKKVIRPKAKPNRVKNLNNKEKKK